MSMGKRRLKTQGDEWDAFSRWGRKYLTCMTRAGFRSGIKAGYRRRERHRAKQELREDREY